MSKSKSPNETPGTEREYGMTVIEYVTEEVERQGHDVMAIDGIERVGYMLSAWKYALVQSKKRQLPNIFDVIAIGQIIEPVFNKDGFRECRVTVGGSRTPEAHEVPALLVQLFKDLVTFSKEQEKSSDWITPMEFYRRFELIHPFRDGNGRTGKVLLNWVNGSLLDPIFPPNDLFGRRIVNP